VTTLIAVAYLGGNAVVFTALYARDTHHDLNYGVVVEGDGASVYLHLVVTNVLGNGLDESERTVIKHYVNIIQAGFDVWI